ncbi:DUF397 domain-containing protein [Streptomyces sp. Edi2]|uniref:DUF397 domain-containing protein n=1 Tax=Streptomyces sp. Edi2 TaxID=3162528 RepID=UPI0033068CD8
MCRAGICSQSADSNVQDVQGTCVEAAARATVGTLMVRDSKDSRGPALALTSGARPRGRGSGVLLVEPTASVGESNVPRSGIGRWQQDRVQSVLSPGQ